MGDRVCVRGCTIRGVHYATCADYGKPAGDAECKGCAPRECRDGVLICERCYRLLRRHVEDAADVVAHLRSIADPTRAQAFDRVRSSSARPEMPAPVAADLIDASDDIVRTMRSWALYVQFGGDHPWRAQGLEAGIDAADAWDDVHGCAEVILDELDSLANDHAQIAALCDGVIVVHEGSPVVWTVADAVLRWPLDDRARWASAPCPRCDRLTVRVQPAPGGRRPTRYRCASEDCGWEANARDDGGLWASVFADPVPPVVLPHDPQLLTLAAAARLVRRTVGTIRAWVHAGDLARELGRVRRADVLAVAERKEQS